MTKVLTVDGVPGNFNFWGERSNSEYSLLKRNNRTLAVKKFWYTYEEYDREESAAYDAQNGD